MKLVKRAISVGNSAGVLLPKKYLGSLIEINIKSLSKEEIKKQVLDITRDYLKHIMGIYLVGSYARNEENIDSDVDVVIITSRRIDIQQVSNYHLICLEYKDLIKELEENIITAYPMLMEAEAILNGALLRDLLKKAVTKKNLQWHLETTKSALKIIKKALETKEKELIVNNAVIYSLMLRLRQVYLVDCILDKKIGSIKGLMDYCKKLNFVERLYKAYKECRDKNKLITKLSVEEIGGGYEFVKNKLEKQEDRINGLKKEEKTIKKEN